MSNGDTSTRKDHPPSGGITSKSFNSSTATSRRRFHSSTDVSIPSFGSLMAAAAAPMAIPVWHTTLLILTRITSAMISAGPTAQPTRQPIMRYSLVTAPQVITLSRIPEKDAG